MRYLTPRICCLVGAIACAEQARAQEEDASRRTLPGTASLVEEQPLSDRILDGTDRFLDAKIAAARPRREARWREIMKSPPDARDRELERLRSRLREITGVIDPRISPIVPQTHSPLGKPSALAATGEIVVEEIRWPVIEGYEAAGLIVRPAGNRLENPPLATVVVMPDADTPVEELVGLRPSATSSAGLPLQLAALGCRVIIPYPIARQQEQRGGRVVLTDREYAYRTMFVLGRHPLGLEAQSVLALVDWVYAEAAAADTNSGAGAQTANVKPPVALIGHGEGGLAAMLAAAIDTRVDHVMISGAFGNRDAMWSEPIGRNLFGLLSDFGDAQLACMIAPRTLIIEPSPVREFEVTADGAAPGKITPPTLHQVQQEVRAVEAIVGGEAPWLRLVGVENDKSGEGGQMGEFASPLAVRELLASMGIDAQSMPERSALCDAIRAAAVRPATPHRARMLSQIENLSDTWIRTSRRVREQWIEQLDTSSLAAYQQSIQPHRERFEREVIGRFDDPLKDPATRSRIWKQTPHWTGWQVEMDVFPEVIAGGILLIPNGAETDAPRPVVVCVHGLEGTPADTIEGQHRAYRDFADRLCRRGYIVFCPQQLYLGQDRFRMLQRKANAIGKTLFSIMIPQHRQIIRVLQGFDFVDPDRIAFYGLSYGGKSAMRIPAVITEYGPTICSGDYNEWVLKNASTRDPFSYVWTPEYEIFEFNLANTFNYAEMAALICPRPFMVERGHYDTVGIDRWVAFEYAPVRLLYAAKLGIPERTQIEFFNGPHAINGEGTFEFLDEHLHGPPDGAEAPAERAE